MVEPSEESEMEEELSEEGSSGSKGRWIMNKGLGIGRKILVTGMVISSAPLVLPPLVVISAIGLAFCVPSGVVLASYACTEKLMNKLLPYSTTSSLLLENEPTLMLYNQEEEEKEEGTCRVGGQGQIDVENEEGCIALEGSEMRIEFVEKEHDESNGGEDDENAQEYGTVDVYRTVEENDYGEGVGECFDAEEEPMLEDVDRVKSVDYDYEDDTLLDKNPDVGEASNVIEGGKKIGAAHTEVTNIVMEESEGQEKESDSIVVEEELLGETRGLLEKIRDEGNVDNAVEMGNEELGVAPPIEVTAIVIEENEGQESANDIVEDAEFVEDTRGLLEKVRDEGNADNGIEVRDQKIGRNVEETKIPYEDKYAVVGFEEVGVREIPEQEIKYVYNANPGSQNGDVGSVLESENTDNNLEAENPMAEARTLCLAVSSIVVDKEKPMVINKEEILQGKRAEDSTNDTGFQLITEKEVGASSNADARAISDESRLNLFNEKNVSGQQYLHASYETSGGPEEDEGADFAELPVSRGARESSEAGIAPGKEFVVHTNEGMYDEAKMREKIDAMRSIVGYKGTHHATCIEELKALYLFTGVEPPASFNDQPDIAQVDNQLRFLMSIIGVKVD